MNRREFIKKSVAAGIVTGSALMAAPVSLFAEEKKQKPYDLVAVKGGEPAALFDSAISALGGMVAFVPKNSTVVVKPNIGWDADPRRAANTHPELVKQIIRHCLSAGAKKVYVFDNTCDIWTRTYKNSGIEYAVNDAGGTMIPANTERYFHPVTVDKGKRLNQAKVHEQVLEADVFINVPVLKHHSSAKLTIGMKNHMGIVWDRGYWHRNDLNQCIADFATFKKPDLTVVDAYNVLMKHGPRGVSEKDVVTMKSLIISLDPVAADAAAAKMFGMEPSDLSYISMAAAMGVGNMDLTKASIKRIKL
ncbi:MAG: DUF362 domain-containing protein [Proteobacteria bacterium]|nr:DUF362 domain-containing protein [Pseudomonadota bacterium]